MKIITLHALVLFVNNKKMNLSRYISTIFLLYVLLTLSVTGQENSLFADTSYFFTTNDDYNLILAADLGQLDHVKLLLSRGADINTSTYEGVTPLMYAANNGYFDIVKLLIDHAADVNLQPINGATALIAASQGNHFDVAELLITNGANANKRDIYGVTAVHYASAYNFYELTDMLIFYGADPEIPDKDGNTPLITASFNNCYEAADILLQNHAKISKQDNRGFTAFMAAIQENNMDIAALLLYYGADINASGRTGMNPLTIAVISENYDMCEWLLNQGASHNPIYNNNIDLVEIASKNKDEKLAELLTTHGIRKLKTPNFNRICFGPSFNYNPADFMSGITIGLLDSKYNTGVYSGFFFRPTAEKVLYPINTDTSYQFWERRYYFLAGAEKRFSLLPGNKTIQTGPYIHLNGLITFGNYRGSMTKPGTSVVFSPSAGWFLQNRFLLVSMGYDHINFKTPETGTGRFSLTVLFTLDITRNKLTGKTISWLTN